MKLIRTEDAVGQVLCQDLTRIVRGQMKGPQFRKGHIITEEDVPMLLSMGKEHLYILEMTPDILHENDAAEVLKECCMGSHMTASEPSEGKIELKADCDGLCKIDTDLLFEINSIEEMVVSARRNNTVVRPGEKLAAMRVVPLVISKVKMDTVASICRKKGNPIVNVVPFRKMKAAVITTGSEVYKGRIKDTFTPVVEAKLKLYGAEMTEHVYCDDDMDMLVSCLEEMKHKNVDMILCTGGMSVDPDDKTPGGIKASGAEIVTYGTPILPGAMFMMGYYEDGKAVMGLPGGVMYAPASVFDLVLPRVLAGDILTRADFVRLGHGGLCLGCKTCHFPNCSFGSN